MKYHVSRDVGHLKFTKIKNPKSPFQVHFCSIILRWQDIEIPIYVNYKSMCITMHLIQNINNASLLNQLLNDKDVLYLFLCLTMQYIILKDHIL